MRLTIINFSLGSGGAERKVALLANTWVAAGHDVHLLTYDSNPHFYRLDPKVTHRALNIASDSRGNWLIGLFANYRRVKALRFAIRDAGSDVAISFGIETNIQVAISAVGLQVPTVTCETTDSSCLHISWTWRVLRVIAYPLADVVTCLTPNVLHWLGKLIHGRGYVIPNPVVLPPENGCATNLPGERRLVAMGRLHPHKGFDTLLDTFSRLAPKHSGWDLVILGEGPLRERLLGQVRALGLEDRVHLLGAVADPFSVLRACDLFVMTSLLEGFPQALTEAMACGLPVVSFDCPSGPRYIIRHGIDGLLVPLGDTNSLLRTLDELMSDAPMRNRLAARAPEVLQRFSLSRFLATWEDVLRYSADLRGLSANR